MKTEVRNEDFIKARNLPVYDEDTGEIIELPRYKTLGNMHLFPEEPGYVNELPSMTVPGQSYTISELQQRMQDGMSVPINQNPEYSAEGQEDPLPIIQDLMDIEEAREFARRILADYDASQKKSKKKETEPSKQLFPEGERNSPEKQ